MFEWHPRESPFARYFAFALGDGLHITIEIPQEPPFTQVCKGIGDIGSLVDLLFIFLISEGDRTVRFDTENVLERLDDRDPDAFVVDLHRKMRRGQHKPSV